jgi:hypothetical protein
MLSINVKVDKILLFRVAAGKRLAPPVARITDKVSFSNSMLTITMREGSAVVFWGIRIFDGVSSEPFRALN